MRQTERKYVELNIYESGVIMQALYEHQKRLAKDGFPTDYADELMRKITHAPIQQAQNVHSEKGMTRNEAR